MKYFLDQEFHERMHSPLFGKAHHIIELISIGIVAEDGREYYAISKDFDLKAAWNSFQMEQVSGDARNLFPEGIKKYWLRDNVLKQVWIELKSKDEISPYSKTWAKEENVFKFTFSDFKRLVKKYGKSNKQIAEEVTEFVYCGLVTGIDFYGYYADYDWVLFCSLFGRMLDLPKGFPMYCNDLNQKLNEKADIHLGLGYGTHSEGNKAYPKDKAEALDNIKSRSGYPKQENEHNAVADARWNKRLHEFINTVAC